MSDTLTLSEAAFGYGALVVVRGFSVELRAGEAVSVLGRNGAGKTTIAHGIFGLGVDQHSGNISFGGKNLVPLQPYARARIGLGLVPQGRRVFGPISVIDHLRMAGRRGGIQWPIDRIFHLFPSLERRMKSSAQTLSGGEQQMLAIARALVTDPDVVIMDEPFEGLAPIVCATVLNIIQELKSSNIGILIFEQLADLALQVSDSVVALQSGETVFRGSKIDFDNRGLRAQIIGVERDSKSEKDSK